jgi:hypothetical protein
MFSRATQIARVGIRAAPAARVAAPSVAARRTVTTNAASARVEGSVPAVCLFFLHFIDFWLRIDLLGIHNGFCEKSVR